MVKLYCHIYRISPILKQNMWRSKLTRFIKTHGHPASVIKRTCSGQYGAISVMDVSAEVRQALHEGKPVIALESTIISHGMPWPDNLETALAVESVVRNQVRRCT